VHQVKVPKLRQTKKIQSVRQQKTDCRSLASDDEMSFDKTNPTTPRKLMFCVV